MYLPLFVGVLCWSLFGMHLFMSIVFSKHHDEEDRAGCFVFLVSPAKHVRHIEIMTPSSLASSLASSSASAALHFWFPINTF